MNSSSSDESVPEILVRKDEDGITRLTLNRPEKYNALSGAMLSALQAALDDISSDENIRVVVIAASGKAFCAGHDLVELRSSEDPEFHRELFGKCSRMMLTIREMPQPVIAEVNGLATAAGCQLVAQCDLGVAARHARFAVSGINVGLFCSTPAVPLSRSIPSRQAMRMLLTGEFISADQALAWGLLNEVVDDSQLRQATTDLALAIAAKSPVATRLGKQGFYRQLPLDLTDAYAVTGETMVANMDSEDAREGIDAFIGKRKPEWKGR